MKHVPLLIFLFQSHVQVHAVPYLIPCTNMCLMGEFFHLIKEFFSCYLLRGVVEENGLFMARLTIRVDPPTLRSAFRDLF